MLFWLSFVRWVRGPWTTSFVVLTMKPIVAGWDNMLCWTSLPPEGNYVDKTLCWSKLDISEMCEKMSMMKTRLAWNLFSLARWVAVLFILKWPETKVSFEKSKTWTETRIYTVQQKGSQTYPEMDKRQSCGSKEQKSKDKWITTSDVKPSLKRSSLLMNVPVSHVWKPCVSQRLSQGRSHKWAISALFLLCVTCYSRFDSHFHKKWFSQQRCSVSQTFLRRVFCAGGQMRSFTHDAHVSLCIWCQ